MSRFIAALVAALLALGCTAPALAATTGLLRGTITVDDKPASGATVTLEGEGSLFKTTTDAKGNYVFPEVPFGSYRLIAQARGAHEIQVLVNVASGQVSTINVPLSTQLQQIAQTTVTAHAGVESNPPSVNQLSKTTIQASPVNNSLNRLLETLPGVVQFSYNEPVINGFHGVTLQHRWSAAAVGDDFQLRRDHGSEDHQLDRAADRRDSRGIRRRPHGWRRQHYQQPAD